MTVSSGAVIWPLSWLISNKPQIRGACNPLNYPGIFTSKDKVRIHSQCWPTRLNRVIVLQFFLHWALKLTIHRQLKLHSHALITSWMFQNVVSLIKLVLVALSGFWSVFPTWQVADVVVFSVPPGRHHYHIIWRVCLIMGETARWHCCSLQIFSCFVWPVLSDPERKLPPYMLPCKITTLHSYVFVVACRILCLILKWFNFFWETFRLVHLDMKIN